jgi:hypothetical protein
MPLSPYLAEHDFVFEPETITRMTTAFEEALARLAISNREDDRRKIIAYRIIDAANNGERDVEGLIRHAVADLERCPQAMLA